MMVERGRRPAGRGAAGGSADGVGGVGLGQRLAQPLLIAHLHVVLQQEADAHGLGGVLRALESRGVDPQLRRRGVPELDLDEPAAALLVLEDGPVLRHPVVGSDDRWISVDERPCTPYARARREG